MKTSLAILVLVFFAYELSFQKQSPKKIDKKMHTEEFKGTPLLIQTNNGNTEVHWIRSSCWTCTHAGYKVNGER